MVAKWPPKTFSPSYLHLHIVKWDWTSPNALKSVSCLLCFTFTTIYYLYASNRIWQIQFFFQACCIIVQIKMSLELKFLSFSSESASKDFVCALRVLSPLCSSGLPALLAATQSENTYCLQIKKNKLSHVTIESY